MDTGPIRPVRGFYSPVNLLVGCQSRVTAALDAQDHGMVIFAFPKSISSPGMMPPSFPDFSVLRKQNPPGRETVGHP